MLVLVGKHAGEPSLSSSLKTSAFAMFFLAHSVVLASMWDPISDLEGQSPFIPQQRRFRKHVRFWVACEVMITAVFATGNIHLSELHFFCAVATGGSLKLQVVASNLLREIRSV